MQRSDTNNRKGRPVAAALFICALALPLAAAPRPYHLELEAYPAAPFPWFAKFGTIDVHVYNAGVEAESLWLKGFSRNGDKDITLMNPVARFYTSMALSDMTAMIRRLSSTEENDLASATTRVQGPLAGRVGSVRASRYRLVYGPAAWIDIWTSRDIPESAQLRVVVDSMIRGVSPQTANAARTIPGTPVYIELNFRRFQKVPFLKLKRLTWSNEGQADALKVGSYYFRAPVVDAIWK